MMNSCNSAGGGRRAQGSMKAGGCTARRLICSADTSSIVIDSSAPIPITSGDTTSKSARTMASSPMAVSPSCCAPTSSMSWRDSPLSTTPSRPTKDEASALWEIMATPPDVYTLNTQDRRHDDREFGFKRSQSLPLSSVFPSYSAPTLVSPKSICPPYDSSLPPRPPSDLLSSPSPASSTVTVEPRKYPLKPRSTRFAKCSPSSVHHVEKSQNCDLGPYLSILPESVIYSIISYIDYIERHPTMLLVSHGMTRLLTRPEFLFELRHTHREQNARFNSIGLLSSVLGDEDTADEETTVSNEMLFIVGGKCPMKINSTGIIDAAETTHLQTSQPQNEGGPNNRRMAMQNNDYCGIMGYDQRRKKWMRFGGDPLMPWFDETKTTIPPSCSCPSSNTNNLHPLSPFGIVDAKPLYLGHPYYCLMFFGGTDYETGAPSSRVVVYSFLLSKWEQWTDMMLARHGEDFHVARVGGCREKEGTVCDSIVLIGCDLEFCDCSRCNPPTCSSVQRQDVDVFGQHKVGEGSEGRTKSSVASWNAKADHMNTMGKCEVLDLASRTWSRRKSRAPSCPPDDGGVAVIDGRFIFMPGTCPPPPTTLAGAQRNDLNDDTNAAGKVVTPESKSRSSSLSSMDTGDDEDDFEVLSLGDLFRSLNYRPGLCYDAMLDQWNTLPARPYVTTSSPTTCSFNNHVVVLGGYRSSSENLMSCYRHREEDSILDYEDHLDYVWWYEAKTPNHGEWIFGGGTTMVGHTKAWAHSSDMAAAVHSIQQNCDRNLGYSFDLPRAPVPVRGGTATAYQGRLTMLGGLSTFSRTFYDVERRTIWQYFPNSREWRRADISLPVPALLDGYAFSIHI